MKNLILVIAILSGCLMGSCVEDVTTREVEQFVKIYGGPGNERGYDILQLNNGGILMLGSTTSTGSASPGSPSSIYLVWADDKGDVTRSVIIPSERDEEGKALIEVTGGYVIVAEATEPLGSQKNIRVVRIATDGTIINDRTVGFNSFNEEVGGVTALPDGGYLIAGTTGNVGSKEGVDPNEDISDILLIRMSANDDMVWTERFGFGGEDRGEAVTLDSEGNIILAGITEFAQEGRQGDNLVLYRVNNNGLETAVRIYGSNRDESVSRLYNHQNQFVLIGSIGGPSQSETAIWQISNALDSLAVTAFSVTRNEEGADIAILDDGSFAVLSNGLFAGNGSDFSYVLVSPAGDISPVGTYGANGNDQAARIFQGNDGKISLYGTVFFENTFKMSWIKPGVNSESND